MKGTSFSSYITLASLQQLGGSPLLQQRGATLQRCGKRVRSCALALAPKIPGLKSLRENPALSLRIWEVREAHRRSLRSGRDDNSSWKSYLAFPDKIVIPTGA
jgi:hypothetical protein